MKNCSNMASQFKKLLAHMQRAIPASWNLLDNLETGLIGLILSFADCFHWYWLRQPRKFSSLASTCRACWRGGTKGCRFAPLSTNTLPAGQSLHVA